jgi:hypothetical protein
MSNHQPFVSGITRPPPTRTGDESAAAADAVATTRLLRTLYLIRAAFSLAWASFVYSFASSTVGDTTIGVLAGVFLVAYPVSDAVGSLVELRTGRTTLFRVPHYLNMTAGFGATAWIAASVLSDLPTAMTIFGIWAVVAGVVQLYLAVQRLQAKVRGQWPMIISGAGSVLGGITYIGWLGSSHDALTAVAQYSAGGAVFYVLTALWLMFIPRFMTFSRPSPRTN